MPNYNVTARFSAPLTDEPLIKHFIFEADGIPETMQLFYKNYPVAFVLDCYLVELPASLACKCNKQRSSRRLRTTYKARLSGIRNNLQTMIEAEDHLLTEEELLQIGRTICKLNRVLSLFTMRTMDLEREGRLDDKGTP